MSVDVCVMFQMSSVSELYHLAAGCNNDGSVSDDVARYAVLALSVIYKDILPGYVMMMSMMKMSMNMSMMIQICH